MNVNNVHSVGSAACAIPVGGTPVSAISSGGSLAESVLFAQGPSATLNPGKIVFVPSAGLTASATAYATILVQKRPATGYGTPTTFATATTQTSASGGTGNWTAWTPVTIPLSAGAYMLANDVLTVTISQTGGGVAVPAGSLCVTQLKE